jgi:hypothetical protein
MLKATFLHNSCLHIFPEKHFIALKIIMFSLYVVFDLLFKLYFLRKREKVFYVFPQFSFLKRKIMSANKRLFFRWLTVKLRLDKRRERLDKQVPFLMEIFNGFLYYKVLFLLPFSFSLLTSIHKSLIGFVTQR